MNQATKRSTIYFDPAIHQALRFKAAATNRSVSALVNQAVREALREDQEDLSAFEERASEPTLSFEEVLKALKGDDDPEVGISSSSLRKQGSTAPDFHLRGNDDQSG